MTNRKQNQTAEDNDLDQKVFQSPIVETETVAPDAEKTDAEKKESVVDRLLPANQPQNLSVGPRTDDHTTTLGESKEEAQPAVGAPVGTSNDEATDGEHKGNAQRNAEIQGLDEDDNVGEENNAPGAVTPEQQSQFPPAAIQPAMSAAADWHFEIVNLDDKQMDEDLGRYAFPIRHMGDHIGTVVYVKSIEDLAGEIRKVLSADPKMERMQELPEKYLGTAFR